MDFVFEALIRKFAQSLNESVGEHFTPRDIVRLTITLVFMEYVLELNLDGNATLDAIFDSQDAYQEITWQLLSDATCLSQFTRFLLDSNLGA